jgi:hypothetical protein
LNRSRCSFRLSGWRLCDWFFGSRFGRQLGSRLRWVLGYGLVCWLRQSFDYRLWCLLRCCLGLRLRFWFWFWFNNRLRSGWGSLFGCWVSRRLC